jgi:hypothetical protein
MDSACLGAQESGVHLPWHKEKEATMELTAFIKIITLVLGFIAFVYLIAWVFQGSTEEDERGRRPLFPPMRRRRKKV